MDRILVTVARTHAALTNVDLRTPLKRHSGHNQRGSVSLEQVIVAVGVAALAVAIVAALGLAVARYTSRL